MTKDDLRQRYKLIRLAMKPADVVAKSQIICQKILAEIDFSKVKTINAYQSIAKLNEVDCSYFLNEVQQNHPEISISRTSELKTSAPSSRKFDLIIVPVLAFDRDNNRLGWGGGWYDRFLAAQPRALKIGLCFSNGLVEDGIPVESHDIPLGKVITDI
jgi:5-formyltetrahydrofolate cyclo-ligase